MRVLDFRPLKPPYCSLFKIKCKIKYHNKTIWTHHTSVISFSFLSTNSFINTLFSVTPILSLILIILHSVLQNGPAFPSSGAPHNTVQHIFCKLSHISFRSHQPDQRAKNEEEERGVPLPAFTPPSNPLKALTRLVLPGRLCPLVYPLVATAADWTNRAL